MAISVVPIHYLTRLLPAAKGHGLDTTKVLEQVEMEPQLLDAELGRAPIILIQDFHGAKLA